MMKLKGRAFQAERAASTKAPRQDRSMPWCLKSSKNASVAKVQFSSVQSFSHVPLFATTWTAAR